MEELINILQEIRPDVDFATETDLVDGGILDSMDILLIVTALEDNYNIKIPLSDLQEENFNSAADIHRLIAENSQ